MAGAHAALALRKVQEEEAATEALRCASLVRYGRRKEDRKKKEAEKKESEDFVERTLWVGLFWLGDWYALGCAVDSKVGWD